MKLVQSILTKNDCYKSGRKITVKGLMLHSVGCPQSNASVFVKNWNRSDLEACVHGFIDGNTGTNYGKNGFIKPGVYTIVEERTGAGASKWGKLKSGAGWISLDYAKKA